jgi:hypothetical protein
VPKIRCKQLGYRKTPRISETGLQQTNLAYPGYLVVAGPSCLIRGEGPRGAPAQGGPIREAPGKGEAERKGDFGVRAILSSSSSSQG